MLFGQEARQFEAHRQRGCGGVIMTEDAGINGQVLKELRRDFNAV